MLLLPKFILISVAALSVWAVVQDYPVVDKFIASQAKREHGEEPEGIRKTLRGDLNRDGLPDLAVLYTIEGQNGSNNYIQYLAVFLQTKTALVYAAHREVGGKNFREVDLSSIDDGVINLGTTNYADKDPSCCPTIKGSTQFVLTGRNLKEKHSRTKPRQKPI
jgi:hypothetical protein